MGLVIVTPPAIEPITLSEAKDYLRVTHTEENTLLTSLITQARDHIETMTRRALLTQTLRLTLDGFPPAMDWWSDPTGQWACSGFDPTIRLPRPRLASVTSIQYVDTAGTTQTLSSTLYTVDATSEPGRIRPAYGQIWPSTRSQMNAVTITYVAGWAAAADLPPSVTGWMYLLMRELYDNGRIGDGDSEPLAVKAFASALDWGCYT